MIFATINYYLQMKHKIFKLAALFALAFSFQVHAITPDLLMDQALRDGKASGVLTGALADNIKALTHSNESTLATIERISIEPDQCHFYKFTVTQPKIPNRSGEIVGDYVTVYKSKICPDNRAQPPSDVIDCRVGNVSCMPSTPVAAPKAPAAAKRP